MYSRRLKVGYFALEGMNSFATVYYQYYFYFFMQKQFGFDTKSNLVLAALNGAVYTAGSLFGGKVAQRVGYFNTLKLGFLGMLLPLAAGLMLHNAAGHIAVMLLMVSGMCLTWPTLEALVSEGEPAGGVQHMVGVYNVVWASTAALANFSGGAMLQHWGRQSLFYVPIAIQLCQLSLTFWLEGQARRGQGRGVGLELGDAQEQAGALALAGAVVGGRDVSRGGANAATGRLSRQSPEEETLGPRGARPSGGRGARHGKNFLSMAWLANPFAYIAINTVVATIPGVASRLQLSTTVAGFCCSAWCFARMGSFFVLWSWEGWHYRFRWLLLAFVTLVVSFAAILLAPSLWAVIVAQIALGGAVGLIYYSSLFYSMDQSDTKSEHGGIHEAAIGLGNCAGPAVGAAALQFLPGLANSGAMAVTVVLVGGLGALVAMWRRGNARSGGA